MTIDQLRDAGISDDAVRHRVIAGRLHRIHRGVYAPGHPGLSAEGRWMAAVLALGEDAVLSHGSAAALWRLIPLPSAFLPDVTVPGHGGRARREGIKVHRTLELPSGDRTRRLNIPVTSPTRTLLDLGRCAGRDEVARARREAEFLGLSLDGRLDPTEPTRSELERRFLALCGRHRLPAPEVNSEVCGHEVDFAWPGRRLVVETDGWAAHRGREAFEADRRRDADLAAAGFAVLRFSWRQVQEEPGTVARAIGAALSEAEPA